jgi:hypothetical protein
MILQNDMGSCAMGAVMLMSTPDRSRLSTYDHNQETQDKIELRIDASLMSVMCVVGETLLMPVLYTEKPSLLLRRCFICLYSAYMAFPQTLDTAAEGYRICINRCIRRLSMYLRPSARTMLSRKEAKGLYKCHANQNAHVESAAQASMPYPQNRVSPKSHKRTLPRTAWGAGRRQAYIVFLALLVLLPLSTSSLIEKLESRRDADRLNLSIISFLNLRFGFSFLNSFSSSGSTKR